MDKDDKDKELYSQAGVIPFRTDAAGRLEVLLIRRTDRKKWGIPKGLIDAGSTPEDTALDEAAEEAGIAGDLSDEPVGYFAFKKWGGICHVSVFLMRVTEVYPQYPEQNRRSRRWFPLDAAAEIARRKKVRALIAELPQLIDAQDMDL